MSRRRGLVPTYDAWAFARLLHGYALDEEQRELVSSPHRAQVGALGDMPQQYRPMEWSRYRNGLADAEDWAEAVDSVDPDSPEPEERWGPLRLGALPPAEPFPIAVFPEPVRQLIVAGAGALGCPPDFLGLPALAAAGGAIGRSVALRVAPGYVTSAAVFAATVARPGDAKTPALRAVAGPLWAIDEGLDADWHAGHDAEGGGTSTRSAPRRLVVSNTTVEALAPALADNPRGLVMVQDELTAWVDGLNQYKARGRGSDRQEFLKVWSGEPILIDRKAQARHGPLRVAQPFLCVVGNLTPGLLGALAEARGRGDGFEDRILFAFPEPLPRQPFRAEGLPETISQGWAEIVGRLWRRPMAGTEGAPCPEVIGLDAEARAAFLALSRALAEEVNADDFPESLRGAWAKLEGYAPRLALILHLLELAGDADRSESGPIPDVSLRAVEGAGRLLAYFKSHAARVRASLDGKGASAGDDVQSLLLWIRRRELESFSESEAKQTIRRFNRDQLGLAVALAWLERQECIRRLPPYLGVRGRPKSPSYLVHPRLHRPPDSL